MSYDNNAAGTDGSIVVCISPLTSLMMDQQAKFTPCGVVAEFVGEMQEDPSIIKSVLQGKVSSAQKPFYLIKSSEEC